MSDVSVSTVKDGGATHPSGLIFALLLPSSVIKYLVFSKHMYLGIRKRMLKTTDICEIWPFHSHKNRAHYDLVLLQCLICIVLWITASKKHCKKEPKHFFRMFWSYKCLESSYKNFCFHTKRWNKKESD